jgi:predicted metal-binding membrane protein
MTATPSKAISSSTTPPESPTAERGRFWIDARPDQRAVALSIGTLVAVAWLALVLWGVSPYDRYLHHGSLDELGLPASVAVTVFVVGWTLMIVAMMLPTAYPVVSLFSAVVARRPQRRLLLALCVTGYLGVWAGFGYVAFVADLGLHAVVDQIGWVRDRPWIIGSGVLTLAGAYQFTKLKYRCLDACRSPRMFVLRRWTGRRERFDSFAVGADSGLFCLGCCWSLMLVMFAAGAGSIPFMLGLGSVMAVEKNVSWGNRISTPLGIALLSAAALVVADGVLG